MPLLTLEGDTLGEKHRHFNKLVADAVASKQYELSPISVTDSDIDNLLKIEIARKTRNVDYVIEVMKSKDMLYAATAIKKSTWLITDPQYANIINPEYLHTQLKPYMTTKAFNKLMLHIRLNLKDESRVEAFYNHCKETVSACRWLQNCSIPFIENVIKNERLISLSQFKRVCKRSAYFLTYYTRVNSYQIDAKEIVLFMLKSQPKYVIKLINNRKLTYIPNINKKKTEYLMRKFPEFKTEVLKNFDKYVAFLEISVLAKYLPKNDIKTIIYAEASSYIFHEFETWRHFLNNMQKEDRFEFIKKTLIDKNEVEFLFPRNLRRFLEGINTYQWYEFLPFNVALSESKNLIRKQNLPADRCSILIVLISSARKNPEHIKALLKYYFEKHINEPYKYKIQFVNALLLSVSAHEFDVETWNYLNQLFHSMEVYIESNNDVRHCLEAVILYNVLHEKPVPEIIEQKFTLHTFLNMQKKLSKEQKRRLFNYILNNTLTKIKAVKIVRESDFVETLRELRFLLSLLIDWNKKFHCYPFVHEKIKELIKIKEKNGWTTDLSCLYNVKKSWRKYIFEESFSLSLCEETCLNALKHKPQLLTRHDKQIHTLRTNDAVSLRRVLAKLRVYWPDSLARHWTEAYMQCLNEPTGHKAVIKGLFILLSQSQVIDFSRTHVPKNNKINWSLTDRIEISIRKTIAMYLHIARPLVALDVVLWYARGDYVHYVVPSLITILSNMSDIESREYLLKLFNAPVSLQKVGLRQAFLKFDVSDLTNVVLNIWNTTKNDSIRSIIFKYTYNHTCNIKNQSKEKQLWNLLSLFLNNINFDEIEGEIYEKLSKCDNIPISIQADFFMKSYNIFTSLPDSHNRNLYLNKLLQCTPKVVEKLDEDFVADKLLSPAGIKLCSYDSQYINSFACYVLCGKSQEDQLLRFNRVLRPAMEEAFQCWNHNHSGSLYVKKQFKKLLDCLGWYFRVFFSLNKVPIPTKLFTEILITMHKGLPVIKNYVLITSWKFVTEYIHLMEEHKTVLNAFKLTNFAINDFTLTSDISYVYMADEPENIWKDINYNLSPSFSHKILTFLKEETDQYSPSIYNLFTDAFENMFQVLSFQSDYIMETSKYMMDDENFVSSYLVVSKSIMKRYADRFKPNILEVRKKLKSNPSKTVKLHYYDF